MGQSKNGFCYPRASFITPANAYFARYGILGIRREYLEYLPSDERRWFLASQVLEQSPELRNWTTAKDYEYALRESRLQDRIKNWPQQADVLDILFDIAVGGFGISIEHFWTFSAFALAGILYGGFHLLAWNAPFTSTSQRTLWRVSGIVIAASAPLVGAIILFFGLLNLLFESFEIDADLQVFFGMVILGLFSLLYLFARAYLIIECFIYLPYLPDTVFQQPHWSQYFPHIT